jgi:hypothetical protein
MTVLYSDGSVFPHRRSHVTNYKFQITPIVQSLMTWRLYKLLIVVPVTLDAPVKADHYRPCKGRNLLVHVCGQSIRLHLYSFFWVIPRRLNFVCPDTSANKIQSSGNHPKERIQHLEHGESLKYRLHLLIKTSLYEKLTSRPVVTRQWTSSN